MQRRAELKTTQHAPIKRPFLKLIVVVALSLLSFSGCDPSMMEKRVEARRLTADVEAGLAHAAVASDRAVLAEGDEVAQAAAKEADQIRSRVLRDLDAIIALLTDLGFHEELKSAEDLKAKFVAYDVLDKSLLALAVQKTNVKATLLSHGPVRQAADAFARAAESFVSSASDEASVRKQALAYQAIADVRQVQVLEGPHIAEPRAEAMQGLEKEMDARFAHARQALETLQSQAEELESVADARRLLDKLVELHQQVVELSRKNTDVQAHAIALGQKRTLTANLKDAVRALAKDLDRRAAGGSR